METFDQRDPVGKAFAGSLLTHGALIALVAFAGLLHLQDHWGSQHASTGSVGVTMVKTIPIPRNQGPTNPLANDTKSLAPQMPTTQKVKPAARVPDLKAIPLPKKFETPKKLTRAQEAATLFKPMDYKPNQLYARTPQATSSAMYGMQGAGGIDIGPASVLGVRFDAYTNLMRDRISQHWNTADVTASPSQKCMVSFTIARNGTVSNVQISKPSGSYLLDTSARRAILDASPLPALPPQYEKSEATVEIGFQLQK